MSNILVISIAALVIIALILITFIASTIVIWVKTGSFIKGITWIFTDSEEEKNEAVEVDK